MSNDLELRLRIRTSADGSVQILNAQSQAISAIGNAAQHASQQVSSGMNASSQAINQTAGSINRASGSIASQMASTMSSINGNVASMNATLGQMQARMAGVSSAASLSARSVGDMSSAVGGLQSAIATLGLAKMASDILATNREFESLRVQMVSVFEGAAEGARAFDRAMEFAVKTPFELRDMTQAMTTLKNFGIEPVNSVMQALTDTAAKTGKGGQALTTVVTQLGQAWSRGSLLAQDMNIITEAGIPINQALAKSLGVTVEKMIDMREHGDLGRDAIKGLIAELGKMSEGSSERAMDTLNGKISNLSDSWHKFQDALLQDKSEGIIKGIVSNWSAWLDEFEGMISDRKAKFAALNANSAAIASEKSMIDAMQSGRLNAGRLEEHRETLAALQAERQKILETTHAQLAADAAIDTAAQQRYDNSTKQAQALDKVSSEKIDIEQRYQTALAGTYKQHIINAAELAKVNSNAMLAIAALETNSGKNIATSSAGAQGLMQIMPKTASALSNRVGLSAQEILTKNEANITASAALIKEIEAQLKAAGKLTIENVAAAYNAGMPALIKAGYDIRKMSKETIDYASNAGKLVSKFEGISDLSKADSYEKTAKGLEKVKNKTHEAVSASEKLLQAQIEIEAMPNASQAEREVLLEKIQKAYEDATGAMDKYTQSQFIAVTAQEKLNEAYQKAWDLIDGKGGKTVSPEGGAQLLSDAAASFKPKAVDNNNKALEDYNDLIKKINDSTGQLGATNSAVFDGALGGINSLIGAFENMTATIDANTRAQDELNKKHSSVMQGPVLEGSEYEKQIKNQSKVDADYQKQSTNLAEQRHRAEIKGSQQMIAASAQAYAQMTGNKAALTKATLVGNAIELADSIRSFAMTMTTTAAKTTAKAGEAIANQASGGDPYTAFARVAAMVALLASFGISSKGGGGTPAIDTAIQGTVLGDREATSKTTDNISSIMQDIHASEYLALLNINDSIKDLSDSIMATITGVFQRGDLATPTLPADRKVGLTGSISKTVSQNSLKGVGNTIGAILEGWQFDLQQYLEIKTTKSFLFGHLVKNSLTTNPVSEQTNRDVTNVFKNIGNILMDAGTVFGMDVESAVKNIRIPDLNIDIKDMTGEEATNYFKAVISTTVDTLATDIFPTLQQYQQIGEGMGETVVRVVADVGMVKSVFDNLSVSLPKTAAGLIDLSEALVKASGGTEKLQANLDGFYRKFYTEREQALDNLNFLTKNLARYDLPLASDRQGYRDNTKAQLVKAGTDSEALIAAKAQLDILVKAAYEPFLKNLEIRKNNAALYGGEDARLYAVAVEEADAAVKAATKTQDEYVTTLAKTSTTSAKAANLMLEQSANADAYYKAIEDGQKALDSFGVSTLTRFNKNLADVQKQMTDLGATTLPTSLNAYKAYIDSIDTSTEAGRRLHDGLVMLAPSVVDLNDQFNASVASTKTLSDQLALLYLTNKDGVITLDNSSNLFNSAMQELVTTFGTAEKAVSVLINAMKVAYSPETLKQKNLDLANANFNNAATAVGLNGLKPEDFRNGLQYLLDNKITSGPIVFEGVTLDVGTLLDQGATLLGNIDAANSAMTSGAGAPASSTQTNLLADNTTSDKANTLSGILKTVNDKLLELGSSDVQRGINAINKEIQDLIDNAGKAGGKIPNSAELKTAQLQKLAGDWAAETDKAFGRIGNSDLQNSLADISDKFGKLNTDAQTLANNGLANLDETLKKQGAVKDDELAKLAGDIFGESFKAYARMGKTELQNSLADIGANFDELRAKAKLLAAASPALASTLDSTLAGLNQLEAYQKKAALKGLIDEYQAIGKTDWQKTALSIQQFRAESLLIADDLAKAYGITREAAVYGINAIALDRAKVAIGWKDIMAEYNAIGLSDAQKAVARIDADLAEKTQQITDTYTTGLITTDEYMGALNITLSVFQERLKALTTQIDEANKTTLAQAGMGSNQLALAELIKKYQDQSATITTVNNSGAAAAANAKKVADTEARINYFSTQIADLKSSFTGWIDSFNPGGGSTQLTDFSGKVRGLSGQGDLDALSNWVAEQTLTGPDAYAWILTNADMLTSTAQHFARLFESLDIARADYAALPKNPAVTTPGMPAFSPDSAALNNRALTQAIYNWFKPVGTEFESIGKSDLQKSKDDIAGWVKDWLAGINDALTALGNTPDFQAQVAGARAQVEAIAGARQDALDKQYKQPLLDQIYTLSHSKEATLAYTRKNEIAALDATLRPLQETIHKLQDLREAATKTQDAINSATASIKDMIATLQNQISGGNTYQGAKNLLQATIDKALAGDFDTIDSVVKNLSALTQDQSKLFATAADYRREQQGVINSLSHLSALSETQSNALNTIVVPGFARGGSHQGGWRMVGENGPELEFTGSSNIVSNANTQRLLNNDELIKYVKELSNEVKMLRDENKQLGVQIVKHTKKTADLTEKSDVIGAPPVRA